MSVRDQIAQQALSLPPEDRVFLADLLEQSLAHADGFSSLEIAAAWAAEAGRRADAYARGELKGVDWQDALGGMQSRLENERAQRQS